MKFIDNIIGFSLRNTLLVALGAVLLIGWGLYSGSKMDIDVFPDLTAPTVVIMTDAGGLTAEETERLVTFPIETAVNGATDVRRVRSASMYGSSFVWAEFDWGTDIYKARQVIGEKLAALGSELPEGIRPVMAPQSSVMGEILFIGLQSDSTSMTDLRTIADWTIKPAILATGGVSQVTVIGGDYKQYQILADPYKMKACRVTMDELAEAGGSFSENSTGGVVREHGNEYALRGMARSSDPAELGATLVKMRGSTPVTIADVAEVRTGAAVKMGHASQNASPAVILSVSKQPNINTLDVTRKIERNLKEIEKTLPSDVKIDTSVFRQADFIQTSVDNVGRALVEGSVFVILVLFIFLNNFRTTLISVVAIPLSLLGTVGVLHLLGMEINTMTLGGMCIAIGSLVDDAIIDVENVYKRLRENHRLPAGERESATAVVFGASKEIRTSILNATLIIIVAFIPLFFLSGMEGRMLKPLGIAYITALFMSLLVAMTVTPLLGKILLSGERHLEKNRRAGKVESKLSAWYAKALEYALGHKRAVMWGTGVLLGIAMALCLTFGQSFLPEFNEGAATISAVAQPGVSLDVNNELGNMIERELLAIPEVTSTARRTGRGELDEHSQATNSAEIDVAFTLGSRSRDEVFAEMRQRLATVPGIAATVGQPLGHRIDHMLSGTRANIAVKVFGPDLSGLQLTANRIKEKIEGIEGVVDVQVEQLAETPQIQIRANRRALARHGITVADFNSFVEKAFAGSKIGEIYENERNFDVVLRLSDRYTGSVAEIGRSLIDTGNGSKVALAEVADIVSTSGPNSISRENVQRKTVVSANVSGRDVGSAAAEIQRTIEENIKLPEGFRVEYGGQFENARSATRTLMWATAGAIAVIFLLLFLEMKSIALVIIILAGLPLALIGGVAAVFIGSGVVSIPAIIGFITLMGIAVRNGILLISRYRKLDSEGIPVRERVLKGSADRLNPILMTALTSALALIPLALASDKPGNEIQSPMAAVVLGGLITSTLLNLFVMPAMYEMHQNRAKRKAHVETEEVASKPE